MKYEEFGKFEELVEKIRRDVETVCGFPVYKDSLLPSSLGFRFYKSEGPLRNVFARIRPRKRGNLCRIYSAKEWATKAGVDDTLDGIYHNGFFGRDDLVHWDVKAVDDERYKEIIGALARIYQVR